ncbi:MAG: glycosyltransferase family A protein [Burkholderia gladioli]
MSTPATIDVVIPVHNDAAGLPAAVHSALAQTVCGTVWIVDDASTDDTPAVAAALAGSAAGRVRVETLPRNRGVALARNWGTLMSTNPLLAFLDADDRYAGPQVLEAARLAFQLHPELGLVRLAIHPRGLAAAYREHAGFAHAWRVMEMTGGGNLVSRRAVLLAAGGFPPDALFRRLGGEDGALSVGVQARIRTGTLFDDPGVEHECAQGNHVIQLLDALLHGKQPAGVTDEAMRESNAVVQRIAAGLDALHAVLGAPTGGALPLQIDHA